MEGIYDGIISIHHDVWEIVPRTKGKFDKYKARFVARRFSQQEGEDYDETVSPVA
jgi:hypothetical protein